VASTGVLLGAFLLLLCARSATAHAIVLESIPARDAVLDRSPSRVVLRFNSKIEKRLSRVTLGVAGGTPVATPIADAGAAGDEAPDRIVVPLRPLPPGAYVLRYKVLSADGHITEGALRFTVTAGH
jgi:methionine-rich copper-binding protein CopC